MNDVIDKPQLIAEETKVGKAAIYFCAGKAPDQLFTLSSTLEGIGVNNDCFIKNNTGVTILSDVVQANHPLVGEIYVARIMSDKIMWAPINCLVISDD